MNFSDPAYDGVKQRYRYSEWPGTMELGTVGIVRSFIPRLADRHPLVLEERAPMRDTPGAFSERYISPTDPEVRVLVDIAVYHSIAAAHDTLLHMLSMAMAPTLPFAADRGVPVGDVAFAGVGEIVTAVLFVRRWTCGTSRSTSTPKSGTCPVRTRPCKRKIFSTTHPAALLPP